MKKETEFIVKREYAGSQSASEAFERIVTPILLAQIKQLQEVKTTEPEYK